MSSRALAVVGVFVCGQMLIGLLAAAALFAARHRASRRAVIQIAVIIALVESFALATGLSAVAASRGNVALSKALLVYVGSGWLVVQAVIIAWWLWAWRRSKR